MPRGELLQVRIVGEEDVQPVLDVESARDAALEQVDPRRWETAALRRNADERGVRVELERVVDAADDRHAVLGVSRRAGRVEDRYDVVAPVAQHPARRLAVMRIGAEALGQDQVTRFTHAS